MLLIENECVLLLIEGDLHVISLGLFRFLLNKLGLPFGVQYDVTKLKVLVSLLC